MRRATVLTAAALLVVAGCGGGGGATEPTPSATTPQATEPAESPTTAAPAPPTGEPAPEALSRFRCELVGKVWKASGYLSNGTKQKATYQVTVYLGPADGTPRQGTTKTVADVAAGGSIAFTFDEIPVEGDGPCRVQVLRSNR